MSCYHHLTVDVEEHFQASAMEPFIPRRNWEALPRKSPQLVSRILEHFSARGVVGTFFVLGWLARREPGLVEAISTAGHEVASHGWDHRRVSTLSRDEFREDLRRSKRTLEDLIGQPVIGYRAPSFSITPGLEWALDVLLEEGFEYDSSMFPVRLHPRYGYPAAPRDPHRVDRASGSLIEVPPATLKVGPLNLPAGGGAYLRFFPLALVSRALINAEGRGAPGTVYFHPWELDEELPEIPAPWMTRLRMRGGVGRTLMRVSDLTGRFSFRPIRETVETHRRRFAEARRG